MCAERVESRYRVDAEQLAVQRAALEEVLEQTEPRARLAHDPLGLVRELPPGEREVGAVVAAALAYGGVQLIRRAITRVFDVTGGAPTQFARRMSRGDYVRRDPDFVYRMTRADDVDALLFALGVALRRSGTLERDFSQHLREQDVDHHAPLGRWVDVLRADMNSDARGARYLTPDPTKGGATKRWHLFLRWVVRPDDGVDLGLWRCVQPAQLVLPLDRHIVAMIRQLGWVSRRTVDYRMARTATDVLLRLDADDPLRYDFALCHLGISQACRHRYVEEVCGQCPLLALCITARDARGAAS